MVSLARAAAIRTTSGRTQACRLDLRTSAVGTGRVEMDALLSNVAHLTRIAALVSAIVAWCYCVYCCNRIERTRRARAAPMPLRVWLGGEVDADVAFYRRRCLISSALFASLIVVDGTLGLFVLA